MIIYRKGDILESETEALVNPVNCDGKMGKGLAYQFKKKYPSNNKKYEKECFDRTLKIGGLLLYKENSKIIINFPTKYTWRENSKIEYIQDGLKKLSQVLKSENIKSISIPPLGSGNGKLEWKEVKKEIEKFYFQLENENIKVVVYEPTDQEMKFSRAHLLIVKILRELNNIKRNNGKEISEISFQKIIYLYDLYYNDGFFRFEKNIKGPFSKLINLLYKDIKTYCKISKIGLKELEEILEKRLISEKINKDGLDIKKIVLKILIIEDKLDIKTSEELENKLELITSILILLKNKKLKKSEVKKEIINWNKRKKEKYSENEISKICIFLENNNFIRSNIFGEYEIILT